MTKNFGFKYKGKKLNLEVEECKTIFQILRGLMFRKKSLPLLFYFGKPSRYGIHSFFCQEFYAIWFKGDEIVDEEFIKPWKISIRPQKKFDRLLEIPRSDKNFLRFTDERKV